MLKRPPQHRADAPIIFVHPDDPAWDKTRIKAEQAAMTSRGEDPKQHPVSRYEGGWTRYDLDATGTVAGNPVCVRDYLDESKQPTMWHCRRLDWAEWHEVHPLWKKAIRQKEDPDTCFVRCTTLGLERVQNGPTLALPGGHPSDEDMRRVHELGHELGLDLLVDIGRAVYQASMPLTDAEGKL